MSWLVLLPLVLFVWSNDSRSHRMEHGVGDDGGGGGHDDRGGTGSTTKRELRHSAVGHAVETVTLRNSLFIFMSENTLFWEDISVAEFDHVACFHINVSIQCPEERSLVTHTSLELWFGRTCYLYREQWQCIESVFSDYNAPLEITDPPYTISSPENLFERSSVGLYYWVTRLECGPPENKCCARLRTNLSEKLIALAQCEHVMKRNTLSRQGLRVLVVCTVASLAVALIGGVAALMYQGH